MPSSSTSPCCGSRSPPRTTRGCTRRARADDGGRAERVRERAGGARGAWRHRAGRGRGTRPRSRRAARERRRLCDGRRGAAGGCGRPGGRGRGDLPRRGDGAPRAATHVERGVAPLAQGRAARASGRMPPSRDDARAGPGPGNSAPGGHAGHVDAGPVGEGVAQSRGIPLEVRDHAVRDADGCGVGAGRLRVRPGRRGRARAVRGGALLARAAPAGAHAHRGDRGAARRDQAGGGGDGDQSRAHHLRDPHASARRLAGVGAGGRRLPRRGGRGVRPRGGGAGASRGGAPRRVRARGAPWARLHLPRGRRGRAALDPRGAARLRGPADRARDATGRGPRPARLRGGAQDPARDVPHLERPHPHRGGARRAPVQALPRAGGRRHPQHRRPADGRHLPHGRVLPRPGRVGTQPTGARAGGARRLRERVSPGVREGRVDLTRAERTGGSLMPVRRTVLALAVVVTRSVGFSYVGSEFVFGEIGKQHSSLGLIFAFQVLPAIIFVSALFAILYYLGVMQLVVKAFAIVMNKVMGASGAESLNVAASIFMGQTEAPLTIRPFLPGMTRSELMTVMTAGMAHVSGSIMAAYIAFGIEARHLLTAVIMTAPGTIMMAKILEPETATPQTLGGVKVEIPRTDVNVVDAAARGTTDGLHLMLNVIAMLVSFIALIALANGLFGWIHGLLGWFPVNIQTVLGWVFSPIAWVMGVPWHDSGTIGGLLGTRMVLNEFIAYAQLGPLKAALDPVSFTIATFALCGFANLSSVGIQIGGIGALAPDRKHDLARLGFRAMIAGTLANFLSATLAGMLL